MSYPVERFIQLCEDMVLILLILKIPITQDSDVEDSLCDASPGSEPNMFFSNNLFSSALQSGIEPVKDYFHHHFTWMTDEPNGSVILPFFRDCKNQRLRP